jgi:hypothetical protein
MVGGTIVCYIPAGESRLGDRGNPAFVLDPVCDGRGRGQQCGGRRRAGALSSGNRLDRAVGEIVQINFPRGCDSS